MCGKKIQKNSKIVVMSYPLTTIDSEGGYNLISDFFQNEKITHYDCYFCNFGIEKPSPIKDVKSNDSPKIEEKFISTRISATEVQEFAKSVGDSMSTAKIQQFLIQYNPKDKEDFVKLYFENRSRFLY